MIFRALRHNPSAIMRAQGVAGVSSGGDGVREHDLAGAEIENVPVDGLAADGAAQDRDDQPPAPRGVAHFDWCDDIDLQIARCVKSDAFVAGVILPHPCARRDS